MVAHANGESEVQGRDRIEPGDSLPFRLDGKILVSFGTAANHCSFYPGAVIRGCEKELARFETSQGTVRFQPGDPIPAPLVRRIVKERELRVRRG